jgi:hypothetical protein
MERRKIVQKICEVSVDDQDVWKAIEEYLSYWEKFKAFVDPLSIFDKETETITDDHQQSLKIWMKIEYDIGQKVNYLYWQEYKGEYCIDYHELR